MADRLADEKDHPAGVAKVTPAAVACGVFFGPESCGKRWLGAHIPTSTDKHNTSALLIIWSDCKAAHRSGQSISAARATRRLGRLLTELQPEPEVPKPEIMGLLALMLLQESRRAARSSPTGELILLENQDRSLWNRARTLTAEERLSLRQLESRPILDKLSNYLLEIQPEVLPKSPAGRAVRYALNNWTALKRYTEDGNLEIDNNGTERTIRGIAVGRNNWMFFGSDTGGKTAAVLRSFVASCQRTSVDPFAWFKDVLSRIADHPITRLAELLPHNWTPDQA